MYDLIPRLLTRRHKGTEKCTMLPNTIITLCLCASVRKFGKILCQKDCSFLIAGGEGFQTAGLAAVGEYRGDAVGQGALRRI